MEQQTLFKVRDKRNKGWFFVDNEYLNGFGNFFGGNGVSIYVDLCRHSDNNQKCFPSEKTIAEELHLTDRTVRKYLKLFEKYHLIEITKERSNQGKWLNNTYWLLDKSEWIKPEEIVSYGKTRGNKRQNQRKITTQPEETNNSLTIPIKNNTNKKNISKDIEKSLSLKKEFGNENINYLLKVFKELTGLSILDGSEKENRRYCWLAIKKFGGWENVEKIIKVALKNDFHKNNLTNFKYLYYNGVKIINEFRIKVNNIAIIKTK